MADTRKGVTVIRTLLDFAGLALAAGTGSLVSCGIYMCEDDAFNAGVLADPETEADQAGWLWRTIGQGVHTASVNDSTQERRWKEDLRGMRKYPGDDYTLCLVLQVEAGGFSTINFDGSVRTLYKMS